MSWEIVRDELLNNVVSLMTAEKQDDGRRWIELLGEETDGKRLGACIIIDIRSGALPAATFASILDCLDFSKEGSRVSARWAFHDAMQNHPANRADPSSCQFVCASSFSVQNSSNPQDIYVRVLDVSEFIIFVLNYNGHSSAALTREDRERAKRMYFKGFDHPWEAIDRMWSGGKGRVFVTALEDLDELISNQTDPGATVNDALGLGMKGEIDFVAVKYEPGTALTVHQPTTLDGNWANDNWYVSCKGHDNWGLTHRCSGVGSAARERVHKALPLIPEGFSGVHIGPPIAPVQEDRDKLLEDAFGRM